MSTNPSQLFYAIRLQTVNLNPEMTISKIRLQKSWNLISTSFKQQNNLSSKKSCIPRLYLIT